jgi:hypothetical protein
MKEKNKKPETSGVAGTNKKFAGFQPGGIKGIGPLLF